VFSSNIELRGRIGGGGIRLKMGGGDKKFILLPFNERDG